MNRKIIATNTSPSELRQNKISSSEAQWHVSEFVLLTASCHHPLEVSIGVERSALLHCGVHDGRLHHGSRPLKHGDVPPALNRLRSHESARRMFVDPHGGSPISRGIDIVPIVGSPELVELGSLVHIGLEILGELTNVKSLGLGMEDLLKLFRAFLKGNEKAKKNERKALHSVANSQVPNPCLMLKNRSR